MDSGRLQIPAAVERFFRESPSGRWRFLGLTYEFDLGTFERVFANVLRFPVQIDLVLGKEPASGSTRLRLWRASWAGLFHPKLILMLANNRVAAGLGSANLTAGGLSENLEAWSFFEGDQDRAVLGGIRSFLEHLVRAQILHPVTNAEEFIQALPDCADGGAVISTLGGSLMDQVTSRLGGDVRRIDIISPLNCDPTSVVRALRKRLSKTNICLYTSEEPVPSVRGISSQYVLERPQLDDREEGIRAVAKMHAKIYAFHAARHTDLFWGSANLSYSAWLARGRRANVDLLLHSRVTSRAWLRLMKKRLPRGHRWKKAVSHTNALPADEKRPAARWRLLHVAVEGGKIRLEATGSGRHWLMLRMPGERGSFRCCLVFREKTSLLPKRIAKRLGFAGGRVPPLLEWSQTTRREWSKIPVNSLDVIPGSIETASLECMLFWEFTGRPLPRPTPLDLPGKAKRNRKSSDAFPDEEELTVSEHQGELDRFVLEWRAIARRIALASGGNDRLRRHHMNETIKRVEDLASREPTAWPPYKVEMVRDLLERQWAK